MVSSMRSRPSRACGLKPHQIRTSPPSLLVTLFAGVWIETGSPACTWNGTRSRPSRACGLKRVRVSQYGNRHPSLPSRACGLQLLLGVGAGKGILSRPSRTCGLKQGGGRKGHGPKQVTPFAGVWIETITSSGWRGVARVTPFAGVWIETRWV